MIPKAGHTRRKASAVLLLLVAATVSAWSQVQFVEEIAADFEGRWREEKINDIWRGRAPYVGGLGFEVVLDGWPRLLQRGFLDVVNKHNGNREMYDLAGWMDLGQIRVPGAGRPRLRLTASTWCYRQYVSEADGGKLEFTVSRLTPALLFRTDAGAIELFAGEKTVGRGPTRERPKTVGVPRHVAFEEKGQIVVRDTKAPVSLNKMTASWVLFWYGNASWFYRSRIPNLVWKMRPVKEYMQAEQFDPADLPVLVVLENRPSLLQATDDALRISFGDAGAGSAAAMPLLGFYHPPAAKTAAWKNGLAEETALRCRRWAARMKAYPLGCTESRQVEPQTNQVTVRQQFSYIEIKDAWDTAAERIAPIPPVVLLAKSYGFPLELSAAPGASPIATHTGPYSGIAGSDTVEFTIRGLARYRNERLVREVPKGTGAADLLSEIRAELQKMIDAGELAPAASLDRHYVARIDWHFANPAETLLTLSEALPYLDRQTRKAVVEYAKDFLSRANPLEIEAVPNFRGLRREYFQLLPPEAYGKYVGRDGQRMASTPVSKEDRLNSVYALWAWADATNDREYLRANWDLIRTLMDDVVQSREWATCSYFRGANETRHWPGAGRGDDRGSVAAANGRFARWIALGRIADRLGNREWSERATYLLARTALLRFAQGKLIRYTYDQGLQNVEAAPDWMYRLSTASGNGGGQGLLWTDHWAGADDDVRQVIQWDEFGPSIAQAWGDHWHATQPLFQDLTPECARFLGDHLRGECTRFVSTVEKNAPAWFITRRPSNIGKETAMDNPRNSYGTFLGKAYALGASGPEMMRCQDIPFVRTGDLYHLRRLSANLACYAGLKWAKPTGAE